MTAPPLLVIKCGSVSTRDVALCRKAGIIVVQVKDPADVRYVEAPLSRSRLERVAVKLVAEIRAGKTMYTSDVDKRLADAFFADETPPVPSAPKH